MLQRIRAKVHLKKIISMIPAMLFLVFIYYMMIRTYTDTVKDTVEETTLSSDGLIELSDSFEEELQENFYEKDNYINLNGLVINALGINTLNSRQRLANGHLTFFEDAANIANSSDSIVELYDFLSDRSIDFLYLIAPSKTAFYDVEFSPGYSSNAGENIDSMVCMLNDAGISTINMDDWFEENSWDMDDVYFKTDHHWKPQAGLAAAKVTMEYLSDEGIADYDEELLDIDNYTVTTLENWMLGSHGKRVGIYYAGVDDIDVYLPNFETDYTFSGLRISTTNWIYSDNPLNLSYTEEKGYYNDDVYNIYLYGNNTIQNIFNTKAINDTRVLVIGDSFRRSWEYFMTTQFKEIYTLDLRYYTDGSLAEYIEEIHPDIVIMCVNSTNIGEEDLYDFGVEEYLMALNKTSENNTADAISVGDIAIEAQEEDNNFKVLYTDLEPGQAYTVTLDSASYTGGEDLYIQITLQDLSTNEAIYNRYIDANSDEEQKWIFTTPDDEDAYAIYIYAGTKGHTKNVSVEVKGIEIQKGIIED